MYAVIETGGKQYRVEVGTELQVELLDVEPGKTITLERVLLVADGAESAIGRPLVADASVSAEVVAQTRGPKLISFKYRPKARSRVKKGHRQELTVLRISDIRFGGKSAATSTLKASADATTEHQRLEEAAVAQAAKDAELAAKLAVGSAAAAKPASKARTAPSETPAESKPAGAAKAAKPASAAKAAKAKAPTTEPEASTVVETAAEAPKRSRAKASPADSGPTAATGPDAAKAAAPKRSRATKKDE
jgi:large subunit ribosomal protein L21